MGAPRTAKGRAREVHRRLAEEYPEALCELDHSTPFQLLTATILSAQCTDARVNQVTPALFARYPAPADLASADPEELEQMIHPTGFYKAKARNLIAMATRLEEAYGGEVPGRLEDLTTLAGVGRKTANVVRTVALGLPGLPVDTHVTRLAHRLALAEADDADEIEQQLNPLVPIGQRGDFGLRLILHGRRVCTARKPACDRCVLVDICPSAALLNPVVAASTRRPGARRPRPSPPEVADQASPASAAAGPNR